jgi:UDP-2,3-diacylglucosamine pyrophosphatase LpxH
MELILNFLNVVHFRWYHHKFARRTYPIRRRYAKKRRYLQKNKGEKERERKEKRNLPNTTCDMNRHNNHRAVVHGHSLVWSRIHIPSIALIQCIKIKLKRLA